MMLLHLQNQNQNQNQNKREVDRECTKISASKRRAPLPLEDQPDYAALLANPNDSLADIMKRAGVKKDYKLATGTFGSIYYSRAPQFSEVVFKHLRCNPLDPTTTTEQEARLEGAISLTLGSAGHPNIGRCFAHAPVQFGAHYIMVLERYNGGSLHDWMNVNNRSWALLPPSRVLKQTLSALEFMHANGVVHYDIKPANVMVCHRRRFAGLSNRYDVRLVDFGMVYQLRPIETPGVAGHTNEVMPADNAELFAAFSMPYRPPERWIAQAQYRHFIAPDGDQINLTALVPRPSQLFPYLTTADVWAAVVTVLDYQMGVETFGGKCLQNIKRMGELWGLPAPDQWPEGDDYLRFKGVRAYIAMYDRGPLQPKLSHRLATQGKYIVAAPQINAARPLRSEENRPAYLMPPADRNLVGVNADKHWQCNACIDAVLKEWNPRNRLEARQALDLYFAKY